MGSDRKHRLVVGGEWLVADRAFFGESDDANLAFPSFVRESYCVML